MQHIVFFFAFVVVSYGNPITFAYLLKWQEVSFMPLMLLPSLVAAWLVREISKDEKLYKDRIKDY